MRITYVYDGTYPSSQADAWQVLNTACALSRAGAKVTLAFSRGKKDSPLSLEELLNHYGIEGDIQLLQLPDLGVGGRSLTKFSHPARAILQKAAKTTDVFYSRNIPALILANVAGRAVVYDTYRPWPNQYRAMKLFFRTLFRSKNMLGAFFHSDHTMNSFASAGIDPAKLRVAHNGYNTNFFANPLSTKEARAELGMDPEAFVVGYTGRLDREKGIHTLLDIAEQAPDLSFLLVGGGEEADVFARIDTLPNVKLFAWQTPSTLPNFLYACDCLMIPPSATPLETGNTVLPMKLFAYFASGRPIVAPRSPDTAELLRHTENSWLLNSDDIADAIVQLEYLRSHSEVRNQLAQTALKESLDMTWDHRGELILNQIDQWIGN